LNFSFKLKFNLGALLVFARGARKTFKLQFFFGFTVPMGGAKGKLIQIYIFAVNIPAMRY
jgi:hypothetical protein